MFPDETTIKDNSYKKGPNLYSWANSNNYKIKSDGFTVSKSEGRDVLETDFLPRRILGEYLIWFYKEITKDLPRNVKIIPHKSEVVDIKKISDNQEKVILSNHTTLIVNAVFLTIGHIAKRNII